MHWSLHSQQLRQPVLHTYESLFPGWCKWNSPYFPPMTPDVISMQQHVTGRELWFWTLPVFHVFGAVSCPAAPWPHLAPSICALSATFCHSAPTLATRFIFVKHGMKRADFSGKDPCPRWGEKSTGLLFGITGGNLHLSESLIEVSTYWIPKWTSLSNKVKTVKYESALFNYVAIESSLYRHFLGRLPVASLSLVARQEFAKAILKIIKS